MAPLVGKTVVLGVTGGISAYKAAELCRSLRKAGAEVRVVMTRAATQFIPPLTLQTLSGHRVALELLDPAEEAEIGHIHLADAADLVIIAPATADAIARMAAGMADDLLTAVVLATRAPVLLAPAMNVNMWENPLTQDNLRRLLANPRITTVGPDSGPLACGWVGTGRLVDPQVIAEGAAAILLRRGTGQHGALTGRRVVITAGPTFEAIDDVRFLGNRSSGKMGFALAAAAAELGAEVTLIAGPVSLSTPPGVTDRRDVESALDMQAALEQALPSADVVVMTAAVADFRPAARVAGKLDRRAGATGAAGVAGVAGVAAGRLPLDLVPNPDLLAAVGARRTGDRPLLVGFAAETGLDDAALVVRALAKLREKRCDVVVANDVGAPGRGFGSDRNQVVLVYADGSHEALPEGHKTEVAQSIWTALVRRLPSSSSGTLRVLPAPMLPSTTGRPAGGRT
jgi:phosphopantothenoylcysteine decarboxylase / phosphopantothenate---cysteine ligase